MSSTAVTSDSPLIRCAAQSAEILLAGHPPDLLGVGLEEDLEEPAAEAVDDPVLEARSGRIGRSLAPEIAEQDAAADSNDAELAQGVRPA